MTTMPPPPPLHPPPVSCHVLLMTHSSKDYDSHVPLPSCAGPLTTRAVLAGDGGGKAGALSLGGDSHTLHVVSAVVLPRPAGGASLLACSATPRAQGRSKAGQSMNGLL